MIFNDLKEANFTEQKSGNLEGAETVARGDDSQEGVTVRVSDTRAAGVSLVDIEKNNDVPKQA